MAPHVLVADDDAWILRMVATVLEKRGYSVETAVDGEDALARALARAPDLLITDVMMPKIDGWSLVRQLRSHPELAMLPVIFLTALSSEDDRIRGFRLGADDYVTKPFRFEELDLRVAKTLRRTRRPCRRRAISSAGSGLRGDLSQVGLSSLLVLIEMERKTGLLQLRAPDGPDARRSSCARARSCTRGSTTRRAGRRRVRLLPADVGRRRVRVHRRASSRASIASTSRPRTS